MPEPLVWIPGLIPLAALIWLLFQGGLGVDPVREIERQLGKTGLYFLIGCLVIPPLRRFTGISLLRQRRAIGLLAFFYILLHLTAWLWLDMGLLWRQALMDVTRRPYLILGMIALLMLLPLALTSTRAAIRRLGPRWKQLHLLIWPAALLAVLHYLWQMKIISAEGWIWLGAFAVLAGWRLARALIHQKRRAPRSDSQRPC